MACGGFMAYGLASGLAVAAVVSHAVTTRVQMYPALIWLATSRLSVCVLGNMAFVLLFSVAKFLKFVFLGTLRPAEMERANDHFRFMLIETLVALTIFREELSTHTVCLFALLLFNKFFHLVSECRVEMVEVDRSMRRSLHVRLVALMVFMLAVDVISLSVCAHVVRESGPSVLLMFGFEYAVMAFTVVLMAFRYTVFMIDHCIEGRWVHKNLYIMYAELFIELIKLLLCLVYLVLIFMYYGIPILMIREVWRSFTKVNTQLQNLIKSRRITQQMHNRFLDATSEQLAEGDSTCIICMEEMEAPGPKRLPCGHMLHMFCLQSWMERQQTCPICRMEIDLNAAPVVQAPPPPAEAPPAADNDDAGSSSGESTDDDEEDGSSGGEAVPPNDAHIPAANPRPNDTGGLRRRKAPPRPPQPIQQQQVSPQQQAGTAPAPPYPYPYGSPFFPTPPVGLPPTSDAPPAYPSMMHPMMPGYMYTPPMPYMPYPPVQPPTSQGPAAAATPQYVGQASPYMMYGTPPMVPMGVPGAATPTSGASTPATVDPATVAALSAQISALQAQMAAMTGTVPPPSPVPMPGLTLPAAAPAVAPPPAVAAPLAATTSTDSHSPSATQVLPTPPLPPSPSLPAQDDGEADMRQRRVAFFTRQQGGQGGEKPGEKE